MNYKTAQELFNTARDKFNGKPLRNNTRLTKNAMNEFCVIFHDTAVVLICPDNTYELYSGGYYTRTTKDRINTYSPARVSQTKGRWFINGQPFVDGMIVDSNGNPTKKVKRDTFEATDNAARKAIKAYKAGFISMIKAGDLKRPSGGDCWLCSGVITGIDHIMSHIEDGYFVPRLLWNAIVEQGYGTPGFTWRMIEAGDTSLAQRALTSFFKKRFVAIAAEFHNKTISKKRA